MRVLKPVQVFILSAIVLLLGGAAPKFANQLRSPGLS